MSGARYSYSFEQDAKTIIHAMKTRPPAGFPKAPRQRLVDAVRILQCVLMGLGALGLGVVVEYLAFGRVGVNLWGTLIGVFLLYGAIFGVYFVTLPTMAARALITRANQGPYTITVDDAGLHTQSRHFESHIRWAGLEGVTRTKSAFIFWLGANRPSLPLRAFTDAAEIDEVDAAIKGWIEGSR